MEGDYPELSSNAEAFIGEVEGRSADNLRRYAATAVGQAQEALRALGYYSPMIDWRIEQGDSDSTASLILSIAPGEPVLVKSRTVEIRAQRPLMTGLPLTCRSTPPKGTFSTMASMPASGTPSRPVPVGVDISTAGL